MKKRHLSEEERRIALRQAENLKEKIEELDYESELRVLQLNKGLDVNYKRQKMRLVQEHTHILNEIQETKKLIEVLRDQITNGVEPKEGKENA